MAIFNLILDLDAEQKRKERKREFKLEKRKHRLEEKKFAEVERAALSGEKARAGEFGGTIGLARRTQTEAERKAGVTEAFFNRQLGFEERRVGVSEESQALSSIVASEQARQFEVTSGQNATNASVRNAYTEALTSNAKLQNELINVDVQRDIAESKRVLAVNAAQLSDAQKASSMLYNTIALDRASWIMEHGTPEMKGMLGDLKIGFDLQKEQAGIIRQLTGTLAVMNAQNSAAGLKIQEDQNRFSMLQGALSLMADPDLQPYLVEAVGQDTVGNAFLNNAIKMLNLGTEGRAIPAGTPISGEQERTASQKITDLLFGGKSSIAPAPTPGTVGEGEVDTNEALQNSLREKF